MGETLFLHGSPPSQLLDNIIRTPLYLGQGSKRGLVFRRTHVHHPSLFRKQGLSSDSPDASIPPASVWGLATATHRIPGEWRHTLPPTLCDRTRQHQHHQATFW